MGWDIQEVPGGTGGNVVASEFGSSFTVQVISLILIVNVHIIIKLVCNSCLHTGMVNYSSAIIDVNLGH